MEIKTCHVVSTLNSTNFDTSVYVLSLIKNVSNSAEFINVQYYLNMLLTMHLGND